MAISTYNNRPPARDDLSRHRENGKHRAGDRNEVGVGVEAEVVTCCHYINAVELPTVWVTNSRVARAAN